MKVTAAYYLLLIYSIALCKPLLPIVKDITAHVFWNVQHFSTIHHAHGDHHVHTEVGKMIDNPAEKKDTQSLKSSEPLSVHILLKSNYDLAYHTIKAKQYPPRFNNLKSAFVEINSPPPRN